MGTKSNKEHTQKSNDYQIISSNQYDTTMNTEKISKLESEKEQSSVSNSITIENTNENININNSSKTIPYIFRWKGNAQKVYITGDFLDNWKNFAEMTKNPKTGEFEYIIYLSKTVHQFKFIVDGNWVFSQDYEISDQGLKFQLVNNDSENSSYKTIVVFPHEKLLHLCFNKNDCYDYKYMRTSATCRIQHKFLTIIYYRPKKGKK